MIQLIPLLLLTVSPDAVDVALKCVCATAPNGKKCRENRREDVTEKMEGLESVASEFADQLPSWMRLPLLTAVACGESGFNNHPTCGGNPRCNDSGTSGGMFQIKIKGAISKAFKKVHGRHLNVFDHVEAGRWYLQTILNAHGRTKRDCRDEARRWKPVEAWNTTVYRVGRGPTVYPAVQAKVFCGFDLHSLTYKCREVEGQKRIPRCSSGSKYGWWARWWWQKNEEAWAP